MTETIEGEVTHTQREGNHIVLWLREHGEKRFAYGETEFPGFNWRNAAGYKVKLTVEPDRVYDYHVLKIEDGRSLAVREEATLPPDTGKLLSASPPPTTPDTNYESVKNVTDTKYELLDPAKILSPTFSIRHDPADSDLADLTYSVKQAGVLQPIIVRQKQDGSFERAVGGRRLRAVKDAKLAFIPVVKTRMDDVTAFLTQLIENLHRKDLTDVEKGRAFKYALEHFKDQFPNQEFLAKKLGKTHGYISQHIKAFEAAEILTRDPAVTRVTSPQKLAEMPKAALIELISAPPEKRAEIAKGALQPFTRHEKPLSARKIKAETRKAKGLKDVDTGSHAKWTCKVCKEILTYTLIHAADGKHRTQEVLKA